MNGFAAIGLVRPKCSANVGSVLRAAHCFDAALVAIQGTRDVRAPTDVFGAWKHTPVLRCDNLKDVTPYAAVPVAVDLVPGAVSLTTFKHPDRAFYIFGPEDGTLGKAHLSWCVHHVMIPTRDCLNLAATVNVVLYDRMMKTVTLK